MDRCPFRLREARLWKDGWLGAQREVDDMIERQIRAAVELSMGRKSGA